VSSVRVSQEASGRFDRVTKLIGHCEVSNFFSFAVVVRDRGEEDRRLSEQVKVGDGQFVSE